MVVRFVYPVKIWGGSKKCLRIQREDEDGQAWFGIEEAIKAYCDEMGLKINEVDWRVSVDPDSYDYESINAKNVKDWVKKFEDLNVIWVNEK